MDIGCSDNFFYDKDLGECSPCALICDQAVQRRNSQECLSNIECRDYYKKLLKLGIQFGESDHSYSNLIIKILLPIAAFVLILTSLLIVLCRKRSRSQTKVPSDQDIKITVEETGEEQQTTVSNLVKTHLLAFSDLHPFSTKFIKCDSHSESLTGRLQVC